MSVWHVRIETQCRFVSYALNCICFVSMSYFVGTENCAFNKQKCCCDVKFFCHTVFSGTRGFYDHFVSVILQFEASSLTDSLPSVTDEGGLQDIENFGIFKGLNGMHYFGDVCYFHQ